MAVSKKAAAVKRNRVLGGSIALCGVLATALLGWSGCVAGAPESSTEPAVEPVGQAESASILAGEGAWCGPPAWPDCDGSLTCCGYSGFPTQWYCRALWSDEYNCGECGNECDSGWICQDSVCKYFGE